MPNSMVLIAEYLGRPWVITVLVLLLALYFSVQLTRLYGAVAAMQDSLRRQAAESKVHLAKQLAEVESLAISDTDKTLVRSLLLKHHVTEQSQPTTENYPTQDTAAHRSFHNLRLFGSVSLVGLLSFGADILSYHLAEYSVIFDFPQITLEKAMQGGGYTQTTIDIGGYVIGVLIGFAAIKAIENIFPIVRRWPAVSFVIIMATGLPFIWGPFTAQP